MPYSLTPDFARVEGKLEETLERADLSQDPFAQFRLWYEEALKLPGLKHPNAMALATVDATGRPSARMLLLKGFSAAGFQFFTNYGSRKGQELSFNPQGALCFYWDKLERQVRIEGAVERLSPQDSSAYFHTRPRLSQLGAWASPQSQEIPSREFLENKVQEMNKQFDGGPIPLPDFWGGYRLVPDRFEFWAQREGRLHDRFTYEKEGEEWRIVRLAP
jgi:pyridoxamine 5'-phosphate oxidase